MNKGLRGYLHGNAFNGQHWKSCVPSTFSSIHKDPILKVEEKVITMNNKISVITTEYKKNIENYKDNYKENIPNIYSYLATISELFREQYQCNVKSISDWKFEKYFLHTKEVCQIARKCLIYLKSKTITISSNKNNYCKINEPLEEKLKRTVGDVECFIKEWKEWNNLNKDQELQNKKIQPRSNSSSSSRSGSSYSSRSRSRSSYSSRSGSSSRSRSRSRSGSSYSSSSSSSSRSRSRNESKNKRYHNKSDPKKNYSSSSRSGSSYSSSSSSSSRSRSKSGSGSSYSSSSNYSSR